MVDERGGKEKRELAAIAKQKEKKPPRAGKTTIRGARIKQKETYYLISYSASKGKKILGSIGRKITT